MSINSQNTPENRKRNRTEGENKEIIFSTSKKVLRSPEQRNRELLKRNQTSSEITKTNTIEETEGKEMEELKAMFQEILQEVKKNTKEMKDLKTQLETKEKEWNKEKGILTERISKLEDALEKRDKLDRKHNIIIKGLTDESVCNKQGIEKFLEETLKIQTTVKEAFKINKQGERQTILVKFDNWNKKEEVMKKKALLTKTDIYMDHDLTQGEQKIQFEIRSIAKEEKNKGKIVTVGYQKLKVDGKQYIWSKNDAGLVEDDNRFRNTGSSSSKN